MSDYDEERLITAMVGREVTLAVSGRATGIGRDPVLTGPGPAPAADGLPGIDFEVGPGEILGIGGLLGSGRSELLLSIFGAEPIVGGEIEIDGQDRETTRPAQR